MGKNHHHSHSGACSHNHGRSHGHQHGHSHGHHHHHHGAEGRMGFALFLNLGFAIIELIGGYIFNSVAILSDALHDFGDSFALLIALILEKVSKKGQDANYSYGYRRFSVLGALITGVILLGGSVLIIVKAVPRLFNPEVPNTNGMLALAVLGVVVNGYAAWKVSKGESLNEKMLMWHMIEDLMGWVLVLVGAVVMKIFDLPQIDAGLAIVLALWISYNVFRNLRETFNVFLMGTPAPGLLNEIESKIKTIPNVLDLHHTHLWSLDGQNHVFTAHVIVENNMVGEMVDSIRKEIKSALKEFGIVEATIEVESTNTQCVDPSHNS